MIQFLQDCCFGIAAIITLINAFKGNQLACPIVHCFAAGTKGAIAKFLYNSIILH
jgi:hypothetical protein